MSDSMSTSRGNVKPEGERTVFQWIVDGLFGVAFGVVAIAIFPFRKLLQMARRKGFEDRLSNYLSKCVAGSPYGSVYPIPTAAKVENHEDGVCVTVLFEPAFSNNPTETQRDATNLIVGARACPGEYFRATDGSQKKRAGVLIAYTFSSVQGFSHVISDFERYVAQIAKPTSVLATEFQDEILRLKEQKRTLPAEEKPLDLEMAVTRARIQASHETLLQELKKLREMAENFEELSEERDELKEQVHGLTKQLHQLSEFDGDWVGEGHGRSVEFRSREERRTPIVSLVNLKGGVGKSTLAVNLAAMYFNRKVDSKRVLIVDLDFQTSATTLCLHAEDRRDSMRSQLNVSRLFEDGADAQRLFQCAKRIGRSPGMIIPGDDSLAHLENKVLAQWLTKQSELDVRFHLRSILHSKEIEDAFDLVILDCPSRLHVASVNALASSDWVLVPMQLDQASADSVPRLLAWLKTFRQEGLCPGLDILGVVVNMKAYSRKDIIHREESIWSAVVHNSHGEWPFGEVSMLKTPIQLSPAVLEASEEPGRFACDDPRIRPAFDSLLREIEPKLFSTKQRVIQR